MNLIGGESVQLKQNYKSALSVHKLSSLLNYVQASAFSRDLVWIPEEPHREVEGVISS